MGIQKSPGLFVAVASTYHKNTLAISYTRSPKCGMFLCVLAAHKKQKNKKTKKQKNKKRAPKRLTRISLFKFTLFFIDIEKHMLDACAFRHRFFFGG